MDDNSDLSPARQGGKRPNLASPYSAASPHLRKPLKATRLVNESDPNLDETYRSTIGNESDVFSTNDWNLEKVVEEEDDTENQFCDENMPPSDREKSMMTMFAEFETTTIVTELPRDSEIQLSNMDLSTELAPEAETPLTKDVSDYSPKEEGSLLKTVCDDIVRELGATSHCDNIDVKSERSDESEEDLCKEDSQQMVLVDDEHPSNLEFTAASGAEIVMLDNNATLSFVLNTREESLSEEPPCTEHNSNEDAVEEMEKSDMLAELPFSNKCVLDCSITSRCSRQLSDSLADFITLENQIDNELNSSGRYLLQEENEALKQQLSILEDEISSLKDNLVKEAKALDIAEKERSDYKFLFEEQAAQLKESKKSIMQQRLEYENKLEEAQLGGNVAEELRRELENERLRNSASEEERNRLTKVVEELRTALSCREKELLQFEEDSKSVTERLSRLTMESSAAAEKMELNCRELTRLKVTLAERNSVFDEMKAEFFESVNKNAEAIAHLKYEGDVTKKLLSEKTAEAETLKAQLDKLEKELQEARKSAVNVIAPIAPVNAAEVTDLQIKIEELTSRLAQKTAEAERAWKACDDMEVNEADYKKRIRQLSSEIDDYKIKCGEQSSPGLLDVLKPESDEMEQPLSPFSLKNSKNDSLNETKNVTMNQSARGSQSFPGGPSPSRKTDATNCQHQ